MNASASADQTLVIPRTQLALLRMETSSPKTLCMLTGELLADEGALHAIPNEVFTRLNEGQLLSVIDELIKLAEDELASEEEVNPQVAQALKCGALGVTFMAPDGSQKLHKKLNLLLGMLLMVDKAVNFSNG